MTEQEELGDLEDNDELYEHYRVVADKKQSLLRIDKFLIDRIPNATRNKIQNAIKTEAVKVNDKAVRSSYKIKPDDIITISLPHPPRDTEITPENIPLDIVYEDDDLLVVNKPAGMVVHPAYQNWTGTLVNALSYHFYNLPTHQNGEGRPGLVHRIDKDTSGLLVIAKTDLAMSDLAKQFFDHSISRKYVALVWGELKHPEGTINANLGRSLKDRRVTAVFPEGDFGRRAVTHYRLIKSFHYVSMIECQLETGRTHQIRAHMQYLGHPIFNDGTYGGDKVLKGTITSKYRQFVDNCFKIIPRQALHAKSLGFIHPRSKQFIQFESELPPDFKEVIVKWENYIASRTS